MKWFEMFTYLVVSALKFILWTNEKNEFPVTSYLTSTHSFYVTD